MKIIVDTREQLPLFKVSLFNKCPVCCKKLEVGDYSTELLRDSFSIERKSPADLYNTIIHNHVRFRNMLLFAAALEIKIVMYIECTRKKFINLDWPGGDGRNISSTTLDKMLTTISERYQVEVVWCKSRSICKKKVYERLRKEERSAKIARAGGVPSIEARHKGTATKNSSKSSSGRIL